MGAFQNMKEKEDDILLQIKVCVSDSCEHKTIIEDWLKKKGVTVVDSCDEANYMFTKIKF